MIKWVAIANRPPTMSVDELKTWWLEIHAPHINKLPGLRKYVISITFGAPEETPHHDGIAELWFDDMAALQKAMESPEAIEGLKDLQSSKVGFTHLFTEEYAIA